MNKALTTKKKLLKSSASSYTLKGKKEIFFDLSSLKQMSKSKPAFFIDMMEIYLRDVPKAVDEMESLLVLKNLQGVGLTAHRIKSNFALFKIKKAVDIILRLERNIENQETNSLETLKEIEQLKEIADNTYVLFQMELQHYKMKFGKM